MFKIYEDFLKVSFNLLFSQKILDFKKEKFQGENPRIFD
jgi:hypothetical protein